MLKIDTVIRNTSLPQLKTRLEQVGVQNYSVMEMNPNSGKSFKPFYCVSRSKIEIICKNSEKDTILQVISGMDDGGIIYVNQITTLIQLNSK